MNKKIKKNIILVSIIMIFIHILGMIYQILSNSPTLSILLKELFIVIYIIHIILLKLEVKYTKHICYGLNLAVAIISAIYMDFSSVIISILLMLYISNLYSNFLYPEEKQVDIKNNKEIEKNTTAKNIKKQKKDVK